MQAISGEELRKRIKRLGLTYARAAERLGLSLDGLNKQMRGDRPVSRQTAIILHMLEDRPHRAPHDATQRRQATDNPRAR
jgi:transcriptional regulator with XRE-family HTH domain